MTGALRRIALAIAVMLVIACGGSADGSSQIIAERTPETGGCGMVDPPRMAGDVYSLEVTGDTTAPFDTLWIRFSDSPPVGQPLALTVEPFNSPDSSQIADGLVDFRCDRGNAPFDSVEVTIVEMPAKDGDPLTIRVQVHFVDGRVLDETFSAALVTTVESCGPG